MLFRLFFLAVSVIFGGLIFLFPVRVAQAGRLYVNTNPLFEACLQRCEEQTPLGDLTRRGCYKGCAEIRRSFGISRSYRSMAACIQDMNNLELMRDLVIEQHQAWCDDKWPHLHKRKGCKDAMEVYIRAATVNSICYHQQPEAIARQTPRTTMTMRRYPAPVPSAPAPAFSGSPSANVLSMPPVYDTPKYRQTSPTTVRKAAPSSSSKTSGAAKAPSLAPPQKLAQPTTNTTSKASSKTVPVSSGKTGAQTAAKTTPPVPVITPSTATSPKAHSQTPPSPTGQTQPVVTQGTHATSASSAPAPPVTSTTVSPPLQPVGQPVQQASQTTQTTQPVQTAQKYQAGQSGQQAGQSEQTGPINHTAQGQGIQVPPPQAPTPVVNAATTPVRPPVISSPMPVLPDFSTATPATPSPTPPARQTPTVPASNIGLLPSLQPSPGTPGQVQSGQVQSDQTQPGQQPANQGQSLAIPSGGSGNTSVTTNPAPPPLPAPMP